MMTLLHHILFTQAERSAQAPALGYKNQWLNYQSVATQAMQAASGLQKLKLQRSDRVAVYLQKLPEAVFSYFGITAAAGVMVPINPVLKAHQVSYILNDCNVRILITTKARYQQLQQYLHESGSQHQHLQQVILLDGDSDYEALPQMLSWQDFIATERAYQPPAVIDADMAAILYTSGSTGKPKGVVLSHRNMVAGAQSVAQYLQNQPSDRLLCVLPFSFDYGFSQLSTAFYSGASCYLLEYLFPQDVISTVDKQQITGLALVPPLWIQLAELKWTEGSGKSLRYISNSGGAMPTKTLSILQQRLPTTAPYLMYGLTEAFRSCYLPPEQIAQRPDSMGKAIPNAEIMVINSNGDECKADEVGELVHRGALVSMGYWNDAARTAERFRPVPCQNSALPLTEMAVWSGDMVRKDAEGYLYFVGRKDDMIKSSGYRISPAEIEEVLYSSGLVAEAVALGMPHSRLGQTVALIVVGREDAPVDTEQLKKHCQQMLPAYMMPSHIVQHSSLPRNPNGKIDRALLSVQLLDAMNT